MISIGLIMDAQRTIQFRVTHFQGICRVRYRVFTASSPVRPSKPGPLNCDA